MRLFPNGGKLFDNNSKDRGVYMKTANPTAGQTSDMVAEYSCRTGLNMECLLICLQDDM
jgi:hypothetical protein